MENNIFILEKTNASKKKSFWEGKIKRHKCHHSESLPHKDQVKRFTCLHKLRPVADISQDPLRKGNNWFSKSSAAIISCRKKTITLDFLEMLVLDEVLGKINHNQCSTKYRRMKDKAKRLEECWREPTAPSSHGRQLVSPQSSHEDSFILEL